MFLVYMDHQRVIMTQSFNLNCNLIYYFVDKIFFSSYSCHIVIVMRTENISTLRKELTFVNNATTNKL